MSKKTTVLTIVIAAVLLLAVVAIAMNAPNRQTADETPTETTETTLPSTTPSDGIAADDADRQTATVTYTDRGFEPASLSVKAGSAIRIENKSSMPLSFNSDDHPAHTDQNELNVGDVPRGGSQEFTVTEKGTWGFHNHENASHTGEITVE